MSLFLAVENLSGKWSPQRDYGTLVYVDGTKRFSGRAGDNCAARSATVNRTNGAEEKGFVVGNRSIKAIDCRHCQSAIKKLSSV